MAEKWVISDPHWFHENIIRFCGRPFANADLMNECLIRNWNSVVEDGHRVYLLGDVFCGGGNDRERAEVLWALKGNIHLIVGNHDEALLKSPTLLKRFQKISYWKGFHDMGITFTHVPHELHRLRDGNINGHGHIHNNMEEDYHYLNYCVEHRDYTPTHFDQVNLEIKEILRKDKDLKPGNKYWHK
jgi:calcineurin-like phosphoesterase family protein